jgi:hypothetical protein
MPRSEKTREAPTLVVEHTTGDFPHARKRGVRLACCTCTTCCFTLLLGGIGGVAGLISGVMAARESSVDVENPYAQFALSILWFLAIVVGYLLIGLLIGGGIGFGIDTLVSK